MIAYPQNIQQLAKLCHELDIKPPNLIHTPKVFLAVLTRFFPNVSYAYRFSFPFPGMSNPDCVLTALVKQAFGNDIECARLHGISFEEFMVDGFKPGPAAMIIHGKQICWFKRGQQDPSFLNNNVSIYITRHDPFGEEKKEPDLQPSIDLVVKELESGINLAIRAIGELDERRAKLSEARQILTTKIKPTGFEGLTPGLTAKDIAAAPDTVAHPRLTP